MYSYSNTPKFPSEIPTPRLLRKGSLPKHELIFSSNSDLDVSSHWNGRIPASNNSTLKSETTEESHISTLNELIARCSTQNPALAGTLEKLLILNQCIDVMELTRKDVLKKIADTLQKTKGIMVETSETCEELSTILLEERKATTTLNCCDSVLDGVNELTLKYPHCKKDVKTAKDKEPRNPFQENAFEKDPYWKSLSSSTPLSNGNGMLQQQLLKGKIAPAKSILYVEPVTKEELQSVPKYMLGRLNEEAVNNFVQNFNSILKRKYDLVLKPAKCVKHSDLTLYYELKEKITSEPQGSFFLSGTDYFKLKKAKLDKTSLGMVVVLSHLGRMKQHRVAGETNYIVQKMN